MNNRFKQIFEELLYDIDIQITYQGYNPFRQPGEICNVYLENRVITPEEEASYTPMKECGVIRIHRYNPKYPNISYVIDTIVMLHEFGHHKNVLVFDDDGKSQSRTGFQYKKHKNEQHFYLLKEELFAWINAFKYLWTVKNIKSLSIYYKILLTIIMLCISIERFSTYIKGFFVRRFMLPTKSIDENLL